MPAGTASDSAPSRDEPARSLGLVDAVSMIVGIILGSGIFVAPAAVAELTTRPLYAVALWTMGAVVAGFGALCYAECGARLPHDGGFFVFFQRAFGWQWAYVAGFAALCISYPVSLAGVAVMGAQYLGAALPALAGHESACAVGAISAAALLNVVGVSLERYAQRLMTLAKVLAILGVIVAAWWVGWRHGEAPLLTDALAATVPARAGGAVGAALVLQVVATIMWTYDGWTDITMVAGEVKDPVRNLPRAVVLSLAVLLLVYAAVQLAVLKLLGAHAIGQPQVLAMALGQAFGPAGEQVLAWLVLLTTWGSLVGLVFATSRLALAMAQEGAISHHLAALSAKHRQPRRAILGVWVLSCSYVSLGSFSELLEMFSLIIWLFYGATAFALLRLRAQNVGGIDLTGFGLNGRLAPFVLIGAAVLMTGLQVAEHSWRAGIVLGALAIGRTLIARSQV